MTESIDQAKREALAEHNLCVELAERYVPRARALQLLEDTARESDRQLMESDECPFPEDLDIRSLARSVAGGSMFSEVFKRLAGIAGKPFSQIIDPSRTDYAAEALELLPDVRFTLVHAWLGGIWFAADVRTSQTGTVKLGRNLLHPFFVEEDFNALAVIVERLTNFCWLTPMRAEILYEAFATEFRKAIDNAPNQTVEISGARTWRFSRSEDGYVVTQV